MSFYYHPWLDAIQDWLADWWPIILVIGGVVAMIVYSALQPPNEYLRVPVEACHTKPTGNRRTYDMPVQNCASYDNNGVCTVPFTTYIQQEEEQMLVTCAYTEWRNK